MRILVLHQWLVTGGIERVLLSYISVFQKLNYQLDILLTYDVGYQENSLQTLLPTNINVSYIFSQDESKAILALKSNKRSSFLTKLKYEYGRIKSNHKIENTIKNKIKENNFDLIIDFSWILDRLIHKPFIAKCGTPIIRWNHSQLSKQKSSTEHFKKLSKYTKIISISKEMTSFLQKNIKLPKDSITTIYNPINIEDITYKSKLLPKFNLCEEYFIVVTRLVNGKGLLELIDIYAMLRNRGIKHKLYIIGDGDYKYKIDEHIKSYSLDEHCILLGEITNPYPYIRNAHLFLFTSESEGLGMVLLESLACETPIIAMDCPTGPKEIIGEKNEYGKLIPMHDKEKFCQAVVELLENPSLYQHYIKEGKKRSLDFSEENIKEQIERTFRKIVSNKL